MQGLANVALRDSDGRFGFAKKDSVKKRENTDKTRDFKVLVNNFATKNLSTFNIFAVLLGGRFDD